MSTNTGNNAGPTNTDDSATDTAHKPATTNTGGGGGSKSNEARTGLNAAETASDLNATMNIKTKDTQS